MSAFAVGTLLRCSRWKRDHEPLMIGHVVTAPDIPVWKVSAD